MTKFIDHIKLEFSNYSPKLFELEAAQAAVLVPVTRDNDPCILLTVRAAHLNSHPGQVSFPGGMAEPEDDSIIATALRETAEEIALGAHHIEVIGQLSTTLSKDGVLVYPIVGLVDNVQECIASPDEIGEIFTVPWSFFAENEPEMQKIDRHGVEFQIPHFYYQGKHIWGLTAMIILEMVNLIEDKQWPVPDFSMATKAELGR